MTPLSGSSNSRPLGPNHALLCGLVFGILASYRAPDLVGRFAVSAEGEGDYTGRILIKRPSGTWAVQIVPVDVPPAGLCSTMDSGSSDSERLAEAFGLLTGAERQLLVCALAGNHPPGLAELRPAVLRGLAKAGARLTVNLRSEARADASG